MGEMFEKSLREREHLIKEKAEDRLLLEAGFKSRELDIKSDERVFKEKELELKQKEIDVRRDELKRSRWINPWTAAFIAAVIGFIGNGFVQAYNSQAQRELEEYRSEAARILEIIKTHDPQSAKKNLKFLLSAGLVSTQKLKDDLEKFLATASADDVPSLPSSTADGNVGSSRFVSVESSRKTSAECEFRSSAKVGTLSDDFKKAIISSLWGDVSEVENKYAAEASGYYSGLDQEGVSTEFVVNRRQGDYNYEYSVELKVDKVGDKATVNFTVPEPNADFSARMLGGPALRSAKVGLAAQMRTALEKLGFTNSECK